METDGCLKTGTGTGAPARLENGRKPETVPCAAPQPAQVPADRILVQTPRTGRVPTAPGAGASARKVILPVPVIPTTAPVSSGIITFSSVPVREGEGSPLALCPAGGANNSAIQPADPRLRPAHPLDDRYRFPGTLPSASLSLYADQAVEVKAGLDGNLGRGIPVPQLQAVGAGVNYHLTRYLDLNVSIRHSLVGTPIDQQGHGGSMGIGVHW